MTYIDVGSPIHEECHNGIFQTLKLSSTKYFDFSIELTIKENCLKIPFSYYVSFPAYIVCTEFP